MKGRAKEMEGIEGCAKECAKQSGRPIDEETPAHRFDSMDSIPRWIHKRNMLLFELILQSDSFCIYILKYKIIKIKIFLFMRIE